MTLFLDVVLLILGGYVLIVSTHLVLLSIAACLPRTARNSPPERSLKIAVIVPAHNEEQTIGETVARILACNYPAEQRSLFVIADNCSDRTAARAEAAGACVAVRADPDNRGKGQALDWFIRSHNELLKPFDVLVFLDADVDIAPDFLTAMQDAFSDPTVQAAQSFNGVANPSENWRTALTYAGFAGVNHLRPLGQTRLFGGTTLKGTGMAFRAAVLLPQGWPARSIVEDMEMTLTLAKAGIAVHYVPEARMVSCAEKTASRAGPQRRRWEGGRFRLMAHYVPRLILAALHKPRLLLLGLLLELLTPPLTVAVSINVLWGVGSLLRGWYGAFGYAALCLVGSGVYVATSLCLVRAPRQVWIALLQAPFFITWKFVVYFGLILRPEKNWVRTARTSAPRKPQNPDELPPE